jgi:hypothetical protein
MGGLVSRVVLTGLWPRHLNAALKDGALKVGCSRGVGYLLSMCGRDRTGARNICHIGWNARMIPYCHQAGSACIVRYCMRIFALTTGEGPMSRTAGNWALSLDLRARDGSLCRDDVSRRVSAGGR